MKVDGRVAIITGGLGGIGKAIGKLLFDRGATVCLVDMRQANEGELEGVFGRKDGRVEVYACDITNNVELEKMFADVFRKHARIDIVINNAGVTEKPLDGTLAWRSIIDVNLTAVINGTRLGLQYMAGKEGNIINVASMGGLLPMPFSPIYSASKHGVVGFTVSVGKELELSQSSIRVNCMCPSFTDTPMARDGMLTSPMMKMVVESQGGLLDSATIGKGMLQLLEDDSKFGAIMRVTQRNGIDYKPERPPPKALSPKAKRASKL